MRASALELRSKICAMKNSRSDSRLACAACIGGHTGYVQERLNDRSSGKGQNARNFNIANYGPQTTSVVCHIAKISLWETGWQPSEKKTGCDKVKCGGSTTVLWFSAHQRPVLT